MAEIAALRERILSVKQTLKITSAMYLISQAKSRRARTQLEKVQPFFEVIKDTIADVLRHSTMVKHPYFGAPKLSHGEAGLVVISGDKGLAGSYNREVIDLSRRTAEAYDNVTLFCVGEMGRRMFIQRGMQPEPNFLYSAGEPTLSRAWEMSRQLLELFKKNKLREILLVYTRMTSPLSTSPLVLPLLPLDPNNPRWRDRSVRSDNVMIYEPSVDAVISRLVPSYLAGVLYAAMTESYCSENCDRRSAMQTATDNGNDMLNRLSKRYNRLRQEMITQQITEVTGGFEATN